MVKVEKKMEVRVKLKVKDIEIELSQEEAKELKDILAKLVGEDHWYPVYPNYPTWPVWKPYKITWGGTVDTPSWTHVEDTGTISVYCNGNIFTEDQLQKMAEKVI